MTKQAGSSQEPRDRRVERLLTEPGNYFSAARQRAGQEARIRVSRQVKDGTWKRNQGSK